MIKLAVDAMGGDYAPEEIVNGVNLAIKNHKDLYINLYGDEEQIKKYLVPSERVTVIHTPYFFDMGEKNSVLLSRHNKDYSLIKAFNAVREKECQGAVTSGPTQCVIPMAQLFVKRLPGMAKIALAPTLPALNGKARMILDVGANVELKPEHIEQLALFASTFMKEVRGIDNPKVGLINIGAEVGKGREQDKITYKLLEANDKINFGGNIEPTIMLYSDCDIYINDGFSCNLVMKAIEGTAKAMGDELKKNIKSSLGGLIGALFMKRNLKNFKNSMKADDVGGALIFGVDGVVVKAHGNSKAYAFSKAIDLAISGVQGGYVDIMRKHLEENNAEINVSAIPE